MSRSHRCGRNRLCSILPLFDAFSVAASMYCMYSMLQDCSFFGKVRGYEVGHLTIRPGFCALYALSNLRAVANFSLLGPIGRCYAWRRDLSCLAVNTALERSP